MSNTYVIDIELTKPFDQELIALVPAEQKRVAELAAAGLVKAGYLRSDNRGAFLIMQADSEAAVRAAIESLPMHAFMKYEIIPCQSLGIGER